MLLKQATHVLQFCVKWEFQAMFWEKKHYKIYFYQMIIYNYFHKLIQKKLSYERISFTVV